MAKYLLTIFFLGFTLCANANEEKEIEQMMLVAHQQARCMDAILDSFPSKKEERIAYSKFYKALVKHHRQFIEYALKHDDSMAKILKDVGDIDILVGMFMQNTITSADGYNEQYDKERVGKSLAEFDKFLWNVNGCDAIYSSM